MHYALSIEMNVTYFDSEGVLAQIQFRSKKKPIEISKKNCVIVKFGHTYWSHPLKTCLDHKLLPITGSLIGYKVY